MSREPVVNFSDISQDKKQELLSFLFNNNITFQEGSGNYIAKVTLKDSSIANKQNREHKNRRDIKDAKDHHRHSPSPTRKTNKPLTQNTPVGNRKKKPPISTPTNNDQKQKSTHSEHKVVSPLPLKASKSNHTRNSTLVMDISQRSEIQQGSLSKSRGRSKSANEKKQQPVVVHQHTQRPFRLKLKEQQLSNSKVRGNTNSQHTRVVNQENIAPVTHNKPFRQASSSHSIKPHPYPPAKFQELTSILHIPNFAGGSRPTRWPRNQVLKTIEQLYSGNFAKNNMLLKHRKFKETYDKGSCTFSNYVIEYFEEKYRTAKLVHSYLLNLTHSLLSYIYEGACSSLTMFHMFITEEYQYQDLVFFLFIRSIFEKEFNTTMDKILSHAPQHSLTKKEVNRFIKAIIGKDSPEIIAEFQSLVAQSMTDTIPVYELFQIFLNDYQSKRRSRSQNQYHMSNEQTGCTISPKSYPISHNQTSESEIILSHKNLKPLPTKQMTKSSGQSLFKDGSSSNFEQLTFGQYNASASNRIEEEDQTQFWNDFESVQIDESDELLIQLQMKLKKKVQELIQIMLGEECCFDNSVSLKGPAKQLGKLILGKALKMLEAIAAMDKMKWFRLIRITKPTQHNLEVVENLQMSLRSLRKLSRDNENSAQTRALQSQICKSLLTVEQLKRAIQKIVIG